MKNFTEAEIKSLVALWRIRARHNLPIDVMDIVVEISCTSHPITKRRVVRALNNLVSRGLALKKCELTKSGNELCRWLSDMGLRLEKYHLDHMTGSSFYED